MVLVKRNLTVADLITENHYTQPEVAKALGKSITYISTRCTQKEPWTTDDMLDLADLFGLSDEEMLQYFAHRSKKGNEKGKYI